MNKNEVLRETIFIIDPRRPLCEFVPGTVKILGVIGDSYAKEKPSVSSSEKGKAKVSRGNKRPKKKKNKRTPNDQSPTMVNSHDQSPIEVNFKMARYDCPTQFDNSDVGDGIGFEDLFIMDLDTFIEQGNLNQQHAPIEKVGVPLQEAALAVVEHPNAIVTTIILVPDTSNDLVEAMSVQSIPTSLSSLSCNLKED